jgi:hypothetical protein
MMFKIESGIPAPARIKITYPLGDMKIGDSFFVPWRGDTVQRDRNTKNHLAAKISEYKRRNPGSDFTCKSGQLGVRCWRVA